MKIYIIRNENGVMLAKISQDFASAIFREVNGFWRKYETLEEEKRCFEITENVGYTFKDIKLYLWEKYLIIEEN